MQKLKPKLFSTLKNYSKEQLVKDIISGIIVAIIALPLSIALALASGATPEQCLYTAIVAGFVISFLGGSRVHCGPVCRRHHVPGAPGWGISALHRLPGTVPAAVPHGGGSGV